MTKHSDIIDDADDSHDGGVEAAMARFHRLVRTEGLMAAYKAAIDVASDKSAPSPARATAATTLMRAAGVLDAKGRDDPGGKSIAQMTAAEMAAEYRRLTAEALDRQTTASEDTAPNVFD